MTNLNSQSKKRINEWLSFRSYVSKERFASYWHQIDEIFNVEANKVLEIGVGSKFVSEFLKTKNIKITTLDREHILNPTIAGSVSEIPLKSSVFDCVLCCQVLEHLPFKYFEICMQNLKMVTKKYCIISLPDKSPALSLMIRFPNFIYWGKVFELPFAIREPIIDTEKHYWEIGRWGFPLKRIVKNIEKVGFHIRKTYRVPEFPYHRFFIMNH